MMIRYELSPKVSNDELNTLFAAVWENHTASDFAPILSRSLVYVCAYAEDRLIGFVNVAWDGGIHAFLLDTTVHADFQRRGIATELVHQAAESAKKRGIEWLHVDFEPHLLKFYRACGFQSTEAGLMNLKTP